MDDGVRLFVRCVGLAVMLLFAKDEPLVQLPLRHAGRWIASRL